MRPLRTASVGNSQIEIDLRTTSVQFSREKQKIQKNLDLHERHHNQTQRKLETVQRSLLILVGKDPYPDISREDALFESHAPGFCYRKDGKARCMRSLQESNTRTIVDDIDGHEGLRSDPAINVVSDTPTMAEVLSNSELVQILCEIRNTGAILSDETLFEQFALNLEKSRASPLLLGFDGPMDFLKQYRKNLIQEFFETLKIEAEIRLFKVRDNPQMTWHNIADDSSNTATAGNTDTPPTANNEAVQENSYFAFPHESEKGQLTDEEWNKAVIEGLNRVKLHEELEKSSGSVVRRVGFEERSHQPSRLGFLKANPTQLLYKSKDKQAKSVLLMSPYDGKDPTKSKESLAFAKNKQRRKFDEFVRKLISKIEILDQMGRGMFAYRKKRPHLYTEQVSNPLVKLLKRQSLFSSLTDDDIIFYELEEASKKILGIDNLFGFPASLAPTSRSDGIAIGPAASSSKQSKSLLNVSFTPDMKQNEKVSTNHSRLVIPPMNKVNCASSSRMKRVCCPACRDKVKVACAKVQRRDNLCKVTLSDAYRGRVPEIGSWPKNNGVPMIRMGPSEAASRADEANSRSVYLMSPPKTVSYRRGAPTPRFPRNNVFSSRIQNKSSVVGDVKSSLSSKYSYASKESKKVSMLGVAQGQALEDDVGKPLDSWTLRISKMDIMRLRHELETDAVKDKMDLFEEQFLDKIA